MRQLGILITARLQRLKLRMEMQSNVHNPSNEFPF